MTEGKSKRGASTLPKKQKQRAHVEHPRHFGVFQRPLTLTLSQMYRDIDGIRYDLGPDSKFVICHENTTQLIYAHKTPHLR